MIRLPERLSREEKLRRLNEIVDILDIRKCLHTGLRFLIVVSLDCQNVMSPPLTLITR
ncbi:hypothetical protein DPMN_007298 [Dreissena polymorpha]|uniref:Uncharacterized protein n=1 Tax=Dreissena polymorpha TaxID=45954 RepID=A0A9D4MVY8_DREPO|nr:hypothetical protein DPMN_007298 [Dreissena polymorpha]